jgi:hypothetical protein
MDPKIATAELRNIFIESKIKNIKPIWQHDAGWELYLSTSGIYLIRSTGNAGTLFLAVSSETGEVRDLTFCEPISMGDHNIVLNTFQAAKLFDMRAMTARWFRTRPR